MPLRAQFDTEAEWLDHLRLWFAAVAMRTIKMTPYSPKAMSICAYQLADEMIAARVSPSSR